MADNNQISLIRQGVAGWNRWRRQNPQTPVDLNEADLAGADLRGAMLGRAVLDYANLSGTDLSGADLSAADLSGTNLVKARLPQANLADARLEETNFFAADMRAANLCEARLKGGNLTWAKFRAACLAGADLRGANATRADLGGADIAEADLRETDLTGANLRGADLRRATFIKSDLTGTIFAAARLGETVFAATSLRQARGLDLCRHHGPSSLDHLTLAASGALPENFLRGCGLTDGFAARLPRMQAEFARRQFCFISHAAADAAFARRLHEELQSLGIRCWRNEQSANPGHQFAAASRLDDKVLLCCSRASLKAAWLDDEIQRALMKEERLGGKSAAFMVLDLDDSVRTAAMEDWKRQCLVSRPHFSFAGWRTGGAGFGKQVRRLLGSLLIPC